MDDQKLRERNVHENRGRRRNNTDLISSTGSQKKNCVNRLHLEKERHRSGREGRCLPEPAAYLGRKCRPRLVIFEGIKFTYRSSGNAVKYEETSVRG